MGSNCSSKCPHSLSISEQSYYCPTIVNYDASIVLTLGRHFFTHYDSGIAITDCRALVRFATVKTITFYACPGCLWTQL